MAARFIIAIAVLCVACTQCALAQCRLLDPDDPLASDIASVASLFLDRLAAHNAPGAKAVFAGPEDQLQLIDSYLRCMDTLKRLKLALEMKFGWHSKLVGFDFLELSLRSRALLVAQCLIMVDGDQASLPSSLFFPDAGLRLRRANGRWFVTHFVASDRWTGRYAYTLGGWLESVEQVQTQLNAGKLASFSAAIEAIGPGEALEPWSESTTWERRFATNPVAPVRLQVPADPTMLLGESLRSIPVTNLIASLPAMPAITETQGAVCIQSFESGIKLRTASPTAVEKRGVWWLELYNAGTDGYSRYPGALPFGLSWSDVRRDVERKLGRPGASGSASDRYRSEYRALGVEVRYARPDPRDPANPIACISFTAANPQAQSALPTTRPIIAFRLVAPTPTPETDVVPDPDDPTDATPLHVLREVLLDETSIADVYPDMSSSEDRKESCWGLGITFTPDGTRRLQEISTRHNGSRLVLMVAGRPLTAPVIQGPISDRVFVELRSNRPDLRDLPARLHAAVFALPATRPTTMPVRP